MKYRKKPVVIDAIRYDGTMKPIMDFFDLEDHAEFDGKFDLYIITLEGNMKVDKGDMIIRGVNGEFYPCKPDIFMKTYQVAV